MFDTKKQLSWSKLKAGLVITLALLILIVAVIFAGGIGEMFSPRVELKAQFKDAKGLRRGSPVWLFGTEVGSVKRINLDPVRGAIVTISIDKSVQTFIKKDAQASILTMGLLGDKYIELSTGSPLAKQIHAGETIKGETQIEFSDIMGTASVTIGKMGEFITKLDNLVVEMERSEGTIAKFFKDPAIYENLNQTTKKLSLLIEDIATSRGTMKMMIEDPSLYNKLLTATSSFEEFSKRLNEGNGTLRKLVEDPSLYNKTLSTISRIEEFSKKLNESHGTLKKLVEDAELYENLNRGSKQLSSILEKIDKGEGLAGAFVRNEEFTRELSEALVEFKKLSVELEAFVKDIKEHPRKYLKFSIF
ncbi:MAG: MCE family protein [Syntrophaceae bacterium]|nr:MCE family protein [Syntrophaceae bacterium]